MCGIVGYVGPLQAADVLVDGLARLEYRGYDSAGVAVFDEGEIKILKRKGRLSVIADELKLCPLHGHQGIGHTRWATHGAPSDENSHPHFSQDHSIVIVHNGIIENYVELRKELEEKGYVFSSQTDTEVVAHLIKDLYRGDILKATQQALQRLKGAYALCIMAKDEPGRIIATRKDSPLVLGKGVGENFIASDIPAILKHTRNVYLLDDGDVADVREDSIVIYNAQGEQIEKPVTEITWNADAAEKGGFDHFMIKEINEQPTALRETMRARLDENSMDVKLDDFHMTKQDLDHIEKIYIVACGTASYAGLIGKYLIEKYARISVETDIASEFRYRNPIINDRTLFIAISQSGETADTLACMRLAKSQGATVLAVTNVVGSTVAREATDILYTWAGPEIAVASTKAYSTQVLAMFLIALKFGRLSGKMSDEDFVRIRTELLDMPRKVQVVLDDLDRVKTIAYREKDVHDVFFLGRGLDFCLSMEGSLKMKEISYIHSEAYQAGELKHGPIALIEDGTIVIALCTQDALFEKMLSNIKEVKARGAYVIALAQRKNTNLSEEVDEVIYIEDMPDDVATLASVAYLQTLAYYLAIARGCDVDKPRNLAKSVTVE